MNKNGIEQWVNGGMEGWMDGRKEESINRTRRNFTG